MVPARVFSREMRRVGQKCASVDVTACFLISDRVKWGPFAGGIGRARAPDNDAMPPASLHTTGQLSDPPTRLLPKPTRRPRGPIEKLTTRKHDSAHPSAHCAAALPTPFLCSIDSPLYRLRRISPPLSPSCPLYTFPSNWWYSPLGRRHLVACNSGWRGAWRPWAR